MNLLKRILTSIEAVQAAVLAILNLLAVFGAVSLTDVQLGALNLAILAIARALAPIIYGRQLDELDAVVEERSAEAVKLAKADITAALPAAAGDVDRGFLESLLSD